MQKLRVLIADDERPAREYLKRLLFDFEDVEIVGEAENGADAVEFIKELKPDLALLDLQMPELSGIEVVKTLRRSQMPLIAFVTAFDEYAVQAFELNAADYLLKPVEKSRLRETITRAAERLERDDWRTSESERMQSAVATYETAANNEPLERIPVRKRDDIFLVPVADVVSIVANGELLQIATKANQKYVINFRLKDLELRLDDKMFVRLSRGAIVNLNAISKVSPMPGGTYQITLTNGEEIASSRLQSRILRSKLLKI
ncbi:MAG TPA: response regulator [Pyrinomonadaceae bacterium]|nr:response regulator [Pyrinomonadaceae bacterium]